MYSIPIHIKAGSHQERFVPHDATEPSGRHEEYPKPSGLGYVFEVADRLEEVEFPDRRTCFLTPVTSETIHPGQESLTPGGRACPQALHLYLCQRTLSSQGHGNRYGTGTLDVAVRAGGVDSYTSLPISVRASDCEASSTRKRSEWNGGKRGSHERRPKQ
jgi:hypothetical protein